MTTSWRIRYVLDSETGRLVLTQAPRERPAETHQVWLTDAGLMRLAGIIDEHNDNSAPAVERIIGDIARPYQLE